MNRIPKTMLFLCLAALLTACNMPGIPNPLPTLDLAMVGTIAAMTLESYPSLTPALTPTHTQPPLMTVTITHTPTITPTFVTPRLQFTGNTNCRKGPGTEYEVVTVMVTGQQAEPLGVSQTGNYWLIKNKDGRDCWVAKDFVQTTGSILALPTVMPPPLPTAAPPNAPVWAAYNYTCDFASGGNNITMNLSWTDRASNEEGYTVYRDELAVTSLGADSTSYVDVAFVGTGKSLTYRVEAFSKSGRASTSTIKASCQ